MSEQVKDTFLDQMGDYQYGFSDPDGSVFKTKQGLNEEVVRQISAMKEEPEWMLAFRLKVVKTFSTKANANLGSRHFSS